MSVPRVAIVGAGILGASIAYHLARRGVVPHVLERRAPADGATGASFAWLNASFGNEPPYLDLRVRSLLEWRALDQELGGALSVRFGGGLSWQEDGDALERQVAAHQRFGYPIRLVDAAEAKRLVPALDPAPERAAFAEWEGHVEPARATAVLLDNAVARGARLSCPCEVLAIEPVEGGVRIETDQGRFEAEAVVVAAGVAAPGLLGPAAAHAPLVDAPDILAWTRPVPSIGGVLLLGPDVHLRQTRDGRVVAGPAFEREGKVEASAEAGEAILDAARRWLPALRVAELERVTLGLRPMPRDERPIVGPVPDRPGVYLAVTHSGITLAPVLGRLVASELLDGEPCALLAPWRPERFASA